MTHAGNTVEPSPKKYRITGMDCGNCALTIEASLGQLPGVEAVTVSFTTETMEVLGDVGADAIAHRLDELGYQLADDRPRVGATLPEHRGILGFGQFLWAQPPLRRAIFVTGAVLIGLVSLAGRAPVLGFAPLDLLFAAAVLIAGGPVFIKGIRAMLFARRITIDLLMAIAAIGALAIGATGEAVTVILLFVLGEALEAYSAERARNSLRSMMALQPQEATVLRAHHDSDHDSDHGTTPITEGMMTGTVTTIRSSRRSNRCASAIAS